MESTLFFAGEATERGGITGTVEAAIMSGRRAAAELLKATIAALSKPAKAG
ncbi:MAG: FAD-dependent oxidoreductase [Bdellovibrionota bacterium]